MEIRDRIPLLPLALKEDTKDTCDEQAWEVRSDAIAGDRMRTREDAARRDAMVYTYVYFKE